MNSLTKDFIIGAVKVNKPFVYTYRSYECAAWWEERTAQVGVYPVVLNKNYSYPHDISAIGQVSAIVTDDYFPALWCGSRIGNEPYRPKHLGESRVIRQGISLTEAIERTGDTPDSPLNWYIDRPWWDVMLGYAERKLSEAYRDIPNWWEKYQEAERVNKDPHGDCVGMMGHFGDIFSRRSREIQTIKRQIDYDRKGFMAECRQKNTKWVRESGIIMSDPSSLPTNYFSNG